MKTRHQEGESHPLTLEEILDETNQLDVGTKVKQVLSKSLINICNKVHTLFYCSGWNQKLL